MVTPAAPGLVLSAPSSGVGMTTVTRGLLDAFASTGREVAHFTTGPDHAPGNPAFGRPAFEHHAFGHHALGAGRPSRVLDPVLVGEHRIAPLYAHGSAGGDVGLVEGVAGLFDGVDHVDPSAAVVAQGSAAHVAGLLGMPVVLVVDVRGYAQTLAAVIRGLATHDPGTRVAGVILNRVGSGRQTAIATDACESAGVPVLGAVPPIEGIGARTREPEVAPVDEPGRVIGDHVDLDALGALAVRPTDVEPWDPVVEISRVGGASGTGTDDDEATVPVTIALAGGAASAHAEHTELLEAAGARVVGFDPLVDASLPGGTCGVVIPGGVPEDRGANGDGDTVLSAAVSGGTAEGMPVHAQHDGSPSPGYREAVAITDSVLYRVGERVTGREFRPATGARVDGPPTGEAAWAWRDHTGARIDEGRVDGVVHSSYLHVHPAGQPAAVARFVEAAREWRDSRSV